MSAGFLAWHKIIRTIATRGFKAPFNVVLFIGYTDENVEWRMKVSNGISGHQFEVLVY